MSLLGISKKGKWIIGGVCAFAVVATATTGLAAWVIGQNTGATGNGNIQIEKDITDTSVKLEINAVDAAKNPSDLVVNFGPTAGNHSVVNATDPSKSEEDLSFTINGTYTKTSASATISSVGAELKLSTEAAKLVTDGYINTPVKATEGKYVLADMTITPASEGSLTGTFTGTYSFGWGSKFGNVNPCKYFDGGKGKGYTEAKAALEALNTLTSPATFTVELTIK